MPRFRPPQRIPVMWSTSNTPRWPQMAGLEVATEGDEHSHNPRLYFSLTYRGVSMPSIYAQLTIADDRRSTSITSEQGEFIVEFLRSQSVTMTLETGFAYGCSAAHILSATSAPHIAIDAYEEGYGNLGLL